MQWLMVQMANVGPMSGQLVHFSNSRRAGQDYGHAATARRSSSSYDLYEQRLAAQPYVAGDDYTIADIAAFPWLRNIDLLGRRPRPSGRTVKAWIDKFEARDARQARLAKVADHQVGRATPPPTTPRTASSARGKYAHRLTWSRPWRRHGCDTKAGLATPPTRNFP